MNIVAAAATNQPFNVTYSQPVQNPYLFFSYFDQGTSFTFAQPFTLAQAFNASASGSTVTAVGAADKQDDGFVVQMQGTYSSIGFKYNNSTSGAETVAFTTGVAVPGPLPLMGVGIALGFSGKLRKLRARLRA